MYRRATSPESKLVLRQIRSYSREVQDEAVRDDSLKQFSRLVQQADGTVRMVISLGARASFQKHQPGRLPCRGGGSSCLHAAVQELSEACP